MPTQRFQPGFRLSTVDVVFLVLGGIGAAYAMTMKLWLAAAIGFVFLHFFLFCNIIRMPRVLEYIWALTFAGLVALCNVFGVVSWITVFAAASVLTVVLVSIAVRQPSYHGVAWQRFNPRLPEWWNAQTSGNDQHSK